MLRALTSAAALLASALLLGGCFTLGSEPSYYMYTDMLTPPGASVMVWPADEGAERFRYVATGWMGSVGGQRVVRELGLPPDASFERYFPADACGVTVLLPAERLEELRPRARLLLDYATALRPGLATSITPVAAEALERPLEEIASSEELDRALERALDEHRLRRPKGFADAFASLYWAPNLVIRALEPEGEGPQGERFAWLELQEVSVASLDEPAGRVVDRQGLVAAVEQVRAGNDQRLVSAWVLEPTGASEGVRAEVGWLMDWFGALEGELTIWQRVALRGELPDDANMQELLEQLVVDSTEAPAAMQHVEVRLSYDPLRWRPNMKGTLVER